MAIAARMAMIVTTIISSISVKPLALRIVDTSLIETDLLAQASGGLPNRVQPSTDPGPMLTAADHWSRWPCRSASGARWRARNQQMSAPPPALPRNLRIGCAGWSIPRQYAALFGEGESMLARYATRFDLAEVNSSFYRSHQRKTWERWAASVPARFRFTAKLPQEISHERALRGCVACLSQFLSEVDGL